MNQGTAENGLRWIADAYSIGFTLTLSEGLSPHESKISTYCYLLLRRPEG
jgi:hypothetical protein